MSGWIMRSRSRAPSAGSTLHQAGRPALAAKGLELAGAGHAPLRRFPIRPRVGVCRSSGLGSTAEPARVFVAHIEEMRSFAQPPTNGRVLARGDSRTLVRGCANPRRCSIQSNGWVPMPGMAQQRTRSRPMVQFTVILDGLTGADVVEVERCLTSARVAVPGRATHPFNQQLRQARERQLRGTFKFEFPCPDEPQRVALHAQIGAANAWARDHRRDIFVRFLVDLDTALAQCKQPKDRTPRRRHDD